MRWRPRQILLADCRPRLHNHEVVLYEASTEIGGQFNLAKKIPGKEEFYETLRYFKKQIALSGVTLMLNTKADIFTCIKNSYDEVVLATGVFPRDLTIDGIHHRKVVGYTDVLKYNMAIGKKVAIIGAGGIGFDVATFLSEKSETTDEFLKTWGVDKQHAGRRRGGWRRNPDQYYSRYVGRDPASIRAMIHGRRIESGVTK